MYREDSRRSSYENVERRISRLRNAVQHCRRQLEPFRAIRRDSVLQYVGKHYSDNGPDKLVPVNLLKLYANVVVRHLVATSPRVMIGTFAPSVKPTAAAMQDWMNKRLVRMQAEETLRRCVLDALFSIGICKVALCDPSEQYADFRKTAGEPFMAGIDLDDWVHDVGAKTLSQSCFLGHRIRVPLSEVQESNLYDKRVRESLSATARTRVNEVGDERIGTIAADPYDPDEYEEHVELWELYLRKERLIVTLAAEGPEQPLRIQKWVGPACGPYHFLSYNDVPGNSMPSAPMSDLIDLHLLVNGLYRKLRNQAERQKTITVGQGNDSDAKRVMDANDGQVILVTNPDNVKEVNYGGVDQQSLAFAIHAKDIFAYMAGNLDILGGLSPQSKTLGQDEMLQQNATKIITDMQARTLNFSRSVMTALGWYYWTDPFQTYQVRRSLPTMPEFEVLSRIGPEKRQQPFEELDFDIDPYSMANDTPSARLSAINQIVMQVLLPGAQAMAAQGVQIDFEAYLRKVAQYANMPDLNEIVHFAQPDEAMQGQGVDSGQDGMGQYRPAETKRTYERVNRPGGTRFGKDNALMQMLMGGGAQESEVASIMQPSA